KKPQTIEERRELRRRRAERKRKFPLGKILVAVVFLAVLCVGIYLFVQSGVLHTSTQAEAVYYTPAQHISGVSLKNTYYLTTIDGLKSVNASGKDVAHDVNSTISPFIRAMKEPVYLTSDKTVLAYDVSGKTALLYDESGIIAPLSFDKEIIRANMNKKGQFVVILHEDGSKAAVKLYNEYGNEIYTWYSGTGYVVDACIHPKNDTMAVLTNDVSGGGLTSKLLFFWMDTPEPVRGQVIGDHMAVSVSYTDQYALILCTNGLYLMTDSGELSLVMQINDRKLKFFDHFTDGSLLLCYENTTSETYQCEVYDKKGRKISEFTLDAFVKIGDIGKDKFLVYKRKEVLSVSKKGKILDSLTTEFEVKDVGFFKNKIAVIGQERMILQ
ncbi:MAG: hypothetical protein IJ367_00760, partial [Clostridia bacterium]|nr:hypothetical protein [Clostridia bacterium]